MKWPFDRHIATFLGGGCDLSSDWRVKPYQGMLSLLNNTNSIQITSATDERASLARCRCAIFSNCIESFSSLTLGAYAPEAVYEYVLGHIWSAHSAVLILRLVMRQFVRLFSTPKIAEFVWWLSSTHRATQPAGVSVTPPWQWRAPDTRQTSTIFRWTPPTSTHLMSCKVCSEKWSDYSPTRFSTLVAMRLYSDAGTTIRTS